MDNVQTINNFQEYFSSNMTLQACQTKLYQNSPRERRLTPMNKTTKNGLNCVGKEATKNSFERASFSPNRSGVR